MSQLEQNTLGLQDILDAVNELPEASEPVLQSKTVSPTTSKQTVTPDSGYDGLSSVVVNAMSTATQATPSITVSTSGLITAKSTQSAGYVAAGTKSATKQLTTQGAKTITPSTSSQTAVASGIYTTGAVTVAAIPSTYVKPTATKAATTWTPTTSDQTIAAGTYCSGAQTIKGDTNLKAENIKSGVSIFGVTGTYAGTAEDLDSVVTGLETKVATLNTALEGKASGGSGGGGVETCTVTLVPMYGAALNGWATSVYANDNITCAISDSTEITGSITIDNVVCGTIINLDYGGSYFVSGENITHIRGSLWQITAKAGETATITVMPM